MIDWPTSEEVVSTHRNRRGYGIHHVLSLIGQDEDVSFVPEDDATSLGRWSLRQASRASPSTTDLFEPQCLLWLFRARRAIG